MIKGEKIKEHLFAVEDLIEKPLRDKTPSRLAIFGRYILTPEIFDCLANTPPGWNGEIQLTDALKMLLGNQPVYAYQVTGRRYDIGNRLDWLIANIDLALDREDLKKGLRTYIKAA